MATRVPEGVWGWSGRGRQDREKGPKHAKRGVEMQPISLTVSNHNTIDADLYTIVGMERQNGVNYGHI